MKKKIAQLLRSTLLIAIGIGLGVAIMVYKKFTAVERVHTLEHPLLMIGGDVNSPPTILPKGTPLYYQKAFSEGFVTYKIYVNVEGVMLDTHEPPEKFWLNPMTAFPVQDEQLRDLLNTYPLTKDQLASILESGQISKADIRKILAEYSKD